MKNFILLLLGLLAFCFANEKAGADHFGTGLKIEQSEAIVVGSTDLIGFGSLVFQECESAAPLPESLSFAFSAEIDIEANSVEWPNQKRNKSLEINTISMQQAKENGDTNFARCCKNSKA